MTTTPKAKLDDVLIELADLQAPPTGDELRTWLARHSDHRHEIVEFVTDWVEADALRVETLPSDEDIDHVVNLTMSQVQRLLDTEPRSGEIHDLLGDVRVAGYDLESFQEAVGIDRSMLTCLAERMVKPPSIPTRLVTAMAVALNRVATAVRAYLLRPPQNAAIAYKAKGKPNPTQVDFQELVERSTLSQDQKDQWRAEPLDPELMG